jgi:integrase
MTAVQDFAADYFVREQLSPGRREWVLHALARFSDHGGLPPEQLTDVHLRAFLHSLVEAGYDVDYVRKYNHAIKPFYRWAWRDARIVDADHYMRIKEVSNPRGATGHAKPRPYKRTEIAQFWQELDAAWPLTEGRWLDRWHEGKSPYRRVWRHGLHLQIEAIACLALMSGLRRQEIFNLSIDDFHPDNDYIVVRGKTEVHTQPKIREVPYTDYGRMITERFLRFRDLMAPDHDRPWLIIDARVSPNHPLVPAHPQDALGWSSFIRQLNKVGPGWELHRFRHTCATEWLRAGMEIERVSRLLGHASIAQTLGYAELVRDDIAVSVRRHEAAIVGHLGRAA